MMYQSQQTCQPACPPLEESNNFICHSDRFIRRGGSGGIYNKYIIDTNQYSCFYYGKIFLFF